MDPADIRDADVSYIDTPYGIFTAAGVWFHTTEKALREYAAPVLNQVSLDTLIEWSEVWIRSPQLVTLWLLPALLLVMSPALAIAAGLAVYAALALLSPAVVYPFAARVLSGSDIVAVQGIFYVFMLSILAAQEQLMAVVVGLVGFILLRWRLVEKALNPVLQPVLARLYPLPIADQILRAFIIRTAVRHKLDLPQVDAIENEILDNWRSKQRQS